MREGGRGTREEQRSAPRRFPHFASLVPLPASLSRASPLVRRLELVSWIFSPVQLDEEALHVPIHAALADLIAQGRVTCDSFGGLRWMLVPAWRRKVAGAAALQLCENPDGKDAFAKLPPDKKIIVYCS